jgi:hypothetical protein
VEEALLSHNGNDMPMSAIRRVVRALRKASLSSDGSDQTPMGVVEQGLGEAHPFKLLFSTC